MTMHPHRRHRVWMAGGALALAAVTLFWYRKYSRRRRNLGDDDLIFGEDDDDDFDKEPDEELQRVFNEAAQVARSSSFPGNGGVLDDRDQLMLYGLYKQATEGNRNEDRGAPSKFNVVAHAKYNSWGKFKGLPKRFAMQKYCEVVYHFANGGDSAFNNNNSNNSSSTNNDNSDIVYDDDDDDSHGDIDEDGYPNNTNGGDEYSEAAGIPGGMGHRPSTLSGGEIEGKPSQDGGYSSSIATSVRLRNAAIANDVAALQKAIQDGCDIDAADDDGQTALHFAADRKSLDCLLILVDAGANVNAVDCDGFGVLQIALSSGLGVESIRILLEAGADPDACDEDGESPRSWVSEEGNVELIDLFAVFPATTD